MPYIKKLRRDEMANTARKGSHPIMKSSGELNYELTLKCLNFLKHKGVAYCTYNEIIGALECCKLEIYRRMVAPYEDIKINENGDVYD